MKIKNEIEGYKIIATCTYVTEKNEEIAVLLGRATVPEIPCPYVTWLTRDGNGGFWGHYKERKEDAISDFITRCKEQNPVNDMIEAPW